LSTTSPTWTDPRVNPGLDAKNPATNHLSYAATINTVLLSLVQYVSALLDPRVVGSDPAEEMDF